MLAVTLQVTIIVKNDLARTRTGKNFPAEKFNVCDRHVIQMELSLAKKRVTHVGQGREKFYLICKCQRKAKVLPRENME